MRLQPKGPGGNIIVCTVKADYPHNSTHVGGTVNFVGSVSCTSTVANIAQTTYLYDTTNGRNKVGQFPYQPGTSSAKSNSALSCINGVYYGVSSTSVTFPPNYVPQSQYSRAVSSKVTIQCNLYKSPVSSFSGSYEPVVLATFVAAYDPDAAPNDSHTVTLSGAGVQHSVAVG